ncbi:MAG: class A beta-lactamase-related serine hydrolase [Bacteroidia bacterium]|nr:MAG: class A beta-lactamase-related serine hydrolase [Bacteroidia bacterium]
MGSRWVRLFSFLSMMVVLSAGTIYITRGTLPMPVLPEVEVPEPVFEGKPLPSEDSFREFIHFLNSELDSTHTVGAAYTIVHKGEVVYTGTYGERNREDHQQVDEHTLFRLASVSKGFAGVLASLLEQDGVFSLSDRVVDRYPGFTLKDSLSTADLTIRHLLSHTSGLVPYAFDNLVEAGQDLYTIIDRLDEVDISAPPGELYGYQNVMFSMIDPIARRTTGVPYQVLLQEKIFRPLGMEDASAGPVDLEKNPNMAYPHVSSGSGYVPLDPREGYYNVLPAAGVNASISDMGQWLLGLLGYKSQWMPDAVLDSITTPLIYTPLKWRYTRYWKPFRERHYSLGWRIYYYQGREIVYHGGYIRGYRAEIAFCPSEDVGVALLMNSSNSLASRFVPTFFDLFPE